MEEIALEVDVSGIVGSTHAKSPVCKGWTTYGIARNPPNEIEGLIPIAANLLNKENLETALAEIAPTHVFITTWMRKETGAENIDVNRAMIRNLLNVLSPRKSVQHVALVTGLKDYLGPFEA